MRRRNLRDGSIAADGLAGVPINEKELLLYPHGRVTIHGRRLPDLRDTKLPVPQFGCASTFDTTRNGPGCNRCATGTPGYE
ncbi:hypothetical protein MABM_08030 [Mycobacteroides abscessus]|nr:hypothetical protein MABM_08030 [Mycobacteroides abscessus]